MRAVWPAGKPMSVRISATDWYDDGITADDAVEIARAFADAGADVVDVSTGQVTADESPAFGRSYQTPFADRIRNEAGIADDGGRHHLVLRRRELDPAGRTGRPVPARPGAPLRPELDAARRRRAGLPRARRRVAGAVAGRRAQAAVGPHRGPEAAPGADPRRRSTGTAHRRWRPDRLSGLPTAAGASR